MQQHETKLQAVQRRALELREKKDRLERKLKADIARIRADIARAESRADSVDKEYEAHGMCCLAGLLIKIDPAYCKKLYTEAQTNTETPAGHAAAIRYALKNRSVL